MNRFQLQKLAFYNLPGITRTLNRYLLSWKTHHVADGIVYLPYHFLFASISFCQLIKLLQLDILSYKLSKLFCVRPSLALI